MKNNEFQSMDDDPLKVITNRLIEHGKREGENFADWIGVSRQGIKEYEEFMEEEGTIEDDSFFEQLFSAIALAAERSAFATMAKMLGINADELGYVVGCWNEGDTDTVAFDELLRRMEEYKHGEMKCVLTQGNDLVK